MESSEKYFLNITGFNEDRIEVTKQEFELSRQGKAILWLDNSPYHVWPSMNDNKKHILSFEVLNVKNE